MTLLLIHLDEREDIIMKTIDPQSWKQDLPAFREKTAAFYDGTLDKAAYKGFSGLYGSYAQKGGKASMLRLRDRKSTRLNSSH